MICDVNGNSPWDTSHWDSHQYDNILYWEWQCAWQKNGGSIVQWENKL